MKLMRQPRVLRRIIPRGLLGRALLILVIPLILLQVVTAVVFFDRHWDTVMRRLANSIAGDISAVISLLARNPAPEDRDWILDMARTHMDLHISIHPGAILPNSGRPRFGSDTIEQSMSSALEERVRRPYAIEVGFLEREMTIHLQLPGGVMEVVAPRKRLFSSTTYVFVMWMVGTALVLTGLAAWFMSKQVRSILRLAASADRFGKGRDVPPIKPEGAREVRQAAEAFNVMRERIQRQIAQRTEMLAGVSHDLRTPLTRMKLQLAMMGDGPDIRDLSEDVVEMERMIEGYLAFARGDGHEPVAPADLAALVDSVAARFRRNGAAVQTVGTGRPMMVPIRHNALDRALSNLLANAQRYARHVRVTLRSGGGDDDDEAGPVAELWVEDDGPGIPVDKREEVFRAFTRLDPSRNPKTGGTGLGLTITRDIVRGHGGEITLHDSPNLGGLKVVVRLPV
ncbi:ATP-binding protein [Novispirillum sp. DQ9]|uniref:ATP-binding protein n=1 Tax=Novispirillum sp. DQ9 TaxID=3398612 RepID=UPI003C7B4915